MRKIYMAGMSHKVAEIAVREKFYIPMDVKTNALSNSPFDELLILATCNRTEVYVASDRDLSDAELVQYVCKLAGQSYDDFAKFFYFKSDDEVAHHVMNVCAGLDSVAMGEDQILHQIGRAYETAHQLHATGNTLNKLFQSAIHTTKRIKTETNLSKLSCNIPFLAMKQVQHTFDDLENRTVYIVGLGEMGSLMLKYVQENTTKIFASSKTFANAEKYSDVLTPVRYEDRYQVIGKCDVVILCSACQEPIITKEEYAKAIGTVEKSKRLVIDLGSPRNAESNIGELAGVQYVCVDDLEKVVSENRRLRMIELEAAQKILKEGIEEFLQWMRMDEVSKQISVHAERMLKSANEESEKLLRSMPDLPEEDRHRVQMMYERFAKKMANDFLYKVKAENSPEDVQVFLKCLGANNE
ncbi:glutamyl-tRNA reductase [Fibrobacter sp. UWB15]|uniref:glutamyl-tRNA reductase n=1 Tax=unclassified Fibrobacter TaxID=2634177 RepID=UPI00091E6D57|nr:MULTISPECIES: glutamyl-tRNA reductase [unclassified Fibrobacter]PWJ67877.1 glutamyl-tRNA reductase [Fibrobacter sp. UWB6]SHF80864.1 glutamyl-tRNA reductase [Fibrobacter sp. UWB8]SMG15939.1 glutamyl-tRNA reductase [Fibrobacter sp. UWB15]